MTENVRDIASASIGIWVESGSRYESQRLNGISHFIEHLLFKGTARRTAREVAEEIESLGGSINAFTDKECTCYHARVLAEHTETALDVLADIFLNSTYRAEDVDLEREVILQEIFDCEDSPEDYIHDYFLESYWPGHPLGWTITGSAESVGRITREDLVAFVGERYRPDRVIVAAAGAIDHDRFVELCRARFGAVGGTFDTPASDRPDFNPGVFVCRRDLEQVHIVAGLPGVSEVDPRRDAAELLITALGGGMSSRLFQSVREERGLAYSIYAFPSAFRDIGYTGIYAATSREHVAQVVDLILAEITSISAGGLAADEVERTKGQLIGSIPLALESTESRMMRIARNQMYYGREVPVSEVIDNIRGTTADEIMTLARELFSFERLGVALLGDAEESMVELPTP
ncbi:MAG: pitrilysin family protein [Candidatus Binatia bacterium]